MLASTTLTASQLIINEGSAGDVRISFKLNAVPILPRGSDIALTLVSLLLSPTSQTDVEKGQSEPNDTEIAVQKMDDTNQEGALKHLRTVTEKISKLHDVLDAASQVRGVVLCFALCLNSLADPSNRHNRLEDCVWGNGRECIHQFMKRRRTVH